MSRPSHLWAARLILVPAASDDSLPFEALNNEPDFHVAKDGTLTPFESHPNPYHNPFAERRWSIIPSPIPEYTHAIVPGLPQQLNPSDVFEHGGLYLACHCIDERDEIAYQVQSQVAREMQQFLRDQKDHVRVLNAFRQGKSEDGFPVAAVESYSSLKLHDGKIVKEPLPVHFIPHWRDKLGWAWSAKPEKKTQSTHFYTVSRVAPFNKGFETIYEWSHELGKWEKRTPDYAMTMEEVKEIMQKINERAEEQKKLLTAQREPKKMETGLVVRTRETNSSVPEVGTRHQALDLRKRKAIAPTAGNAPAPQTTRQARRTRKRTPTGASPEDWTAPFVPEDGTVVENNPPRRLPPSVIRHYEPGPELSAQLREAVERAERTTRAMRRRDALKGARETEGSSRAEK